MEKFSNATLFRQTALQNLQRKTLGFLRLNTLKQVVSRNLSVLVSEVLLWNVFSGKDDNRPPPTPVTLRVDQALGICFCIKGACFEIIYVVFQQAAKIIRAFSQALKRNRKVRVCLTVWIQSLVKFSASLV